MPGASKEQFDAFTELGRRCTSAECAAQHLNATGSVDVVSLLGRITAATLVLHVIGDVRVPFEQGRELAAGIPGAHLVTLPGRNYIPIEGDPAYEMLWEEAKSIPARLGKRLTHYVGQQASRPDRKVARSAIWSPSCMPTWLDTAVSLGWTTQELSQAAFLRRDVIDPAIEQFGEGLFIQFKPKALATWLDQGGTRVRLGQLSDAAMGWTAKTNQPLGFRSGGPYMLAHSLAQALTTEIALDCGYPATALKERYMLCLDLTWAIRSVVVC